MARIPIEILEHIQNEIRSVICETFSQMVVATRTRKINCQKFKNEVNAYLKQIDKEFDIGKLELRLRKLPRKLKKAYKKQNRIEFDLVYIEPIQKLEIELRVEQ